MAIDPIYTTGIIGTIPVPVKLMLSTLLFLSIDINHLDITTHGLVLAQQFQNVDILGNIQNGWNDFLQSGKAGTFTIGLVLGYVVRGITR
jgi:hypothetical protein